MCARSSKASRSSRAVVPYVPELGAVAAEVFGPLGWEVISVAEPHQRESSVILGHRHVTMTVHLEAGCGAVSAGIRPRVVDPAIRIGSVALAHLVRHRCNPPGMTARMVIK